MIVTFVYPSSAQRTGGVTTLYGFADALAARGHEVHFVHGPANPHRVTSLDQLPPHAFHPAVAHHLVDHLTDPSLPHGDVVFHAGGPAALGLPCTIVQGYRMLPAEWELAAFQAPGPKVCVARWLTQVGAALGAPPERLWYVPQGIDLHRFRPRTPLQHRDIDVAVLSHPHRNKGWDVALATLHELRRRRPTFRALAFGVDPLPAPLPPGTEFLLAPTQEELVATAYARTRVFLQASRIEGFGLTAVEAMACGAALVTTDNGGSRDYAVHEATALVAPGEDVRALADAVEQVLDDEGLRARLSRAGRAAVARFDWERSGAELEAKLERYVADPAAYGASRPGTTSWAGR